MAGRGRAMWHNRGGTHYVTHSTGVFDFVYWNQFPDSFFAIFLEMKWAAYNVVMR
jgi:hypothetical protein